LQTHSKEANEAHKANYPSKKAEYGKYIADFLETGSKVTTEQYEKASAFREEFTRKFRTGLSAVDAFAAL
jgi:Asp-tRNA(Asn)/Glu-tRNA(Gln) amidotransferase A subunit family amidase